MWSVICRNAQQLNLRSGGQGSTKEVDVSASAGHPHIENPAHPGAFVTSEIIELIGLTMIAASLALGVKAASRHHSSPSYELNYQWHGFGV